MEIQTHLVFPRLAFTATGTRPLGVILAFPYQVPDFPMTAALEIIQLNKLISDQTQKFDYLLSRYIDIAGVMMIRFILHCRFLEGRVHSETVFNKPIMYIYECLQLYRLPVRVLRLLALSGLGNLGRSVNKGTSILFKIKKQYSPTVAQTPRQSLETASAQ
jgi:hypothetical protein